VRSGDAPRAGNRIPAGPGERLGRVGAILLLAVAYAAAGLIGRFLELDPVRVSPMWPAAGVALAALLAYGRELWPGVLVGSFALNVGKLVAWTGSLAGGSLGALVIAAGATASAVAAAALILQTGAERMPLRNVRGLIAFVVIGAIVCPVINALIGTATVTLMGYVRIDQTVAAAASWWLGDLTGVIVAGPLVLLAAVRHPVGPSRSVDEAVAVFATMVICSTCAFGPWLRIALRYPLTHVVLPPLFWANLRFRLVGAAVGNAVLAAVAITWTALGEGPFVGPDVDESLRMLQFYVSVVCCASLALGVLLEERASAERALVRVREELESRVIARTTALRDSLALLHATLEATADGILVVDRAGKVVTFNGRFLEIWGLSAEELEVGDDRKALEAVTALVEDPAAFLARVDELYAHPEVEAEDVIRLRDGRILERHSRPQWLDGEPVGRVWSFRDVTARKLAERERDRLLVQEQLARKEAEEAVRVRDDFLSIASHELKTPLTTLKLQLQRMERLMSAERVDPALLNLLESVIRQSQRLHALIDELLDVSRITTHRILLEAEPLDLAEVARETVERLREPAARAGSTLTLRFEGDAVGTWDRIRLEQVVGNLVSNAIKYGNGKPIEVVVDGTGPLVELSVRDRGIGISARDQERIFQRFERAVASRHYGGFGLGLWIVRQVVEAMGGRIWVESAPGAGSTFHVVLPRSVRRDAGTGAAHP